MHVAETWSEGYTGKNITVSILDDGLEYTHPDLSKNYVSFNITKIIYLDFSEMFSSRCG